MTLLQPGHQRHRMVDRGQAGGRRRGSLGNLAIQRAAQPAAALALLCSPTRRWPNIPSHSSTPSSTLRRRATWQHGDIAEREWRPRKGRPIEIALPKVATLGDAMVVLFFAGLRVATVAIMGGALLLLTRRLKPGKVYLEIDWPLLLMFVGLFIVITGLETAVLTPELIAGIGALHLESVPVLTAFTALLSNLVSNVPAVLVLKPFLTGLSDPQQAWLVAAMASTLAGNFTLVGSAANLIVAQRARSRGVTRRDRD